MKFLLITTFVLTAILTPNMSQAGDLFSITNRTGSCVGVVCDAFEQVLNKLIPDAETINFLPGMADAGILANKGLATDYASNIQLFSLGAGIGIGLDPGEAGASATGEENATLPAIGIGGTVGLGVNLGIFAGGEFWNRSSVYINYFSYGLTTGSVTGNISSFGIHYQYKLIKPKSLLAGSIKWGGIDITTGYEISTTKIKTTVAIDEVLTESGVTIEYHGGATVGADIDATSIPIEATTNVRLLYGISLYGGFGLDINSGNSKSIADVTGNISVTSVAAGSGDAVLDLGTESGPSSTTLRSIFGLQVNITAIRVFFQQMSVIGKNDKQISLGLRFAW